MNTIIFFAAGVVIGWLIRQKQKLVVASNWGASILLGFLIFLLGLSIGGRPDILENFSTLGLTAVILALASIAGGILLSAPIARRWSGRNEA